MPFHFIGLHQISLSPKFGERMFLKSMGTSSPAMFKTSPAVWQQQKGSFSPVMKRWSFRSETRETALTMPTPMTLLSFISTLRKLLSWSSLSVETSTPSNNTEPAQDTRGTLGRKTRFPPIFRPLRFLWGKIRFCDENVQGNEKNRSPEFAS